MKQLLLLAIFAGLLTVCGTVRGEGPAIKGPHQAAVDRAVILFNGRDLTGWKPVGPGASNDWSVEDGCLVCHGTGHTWLQSSREYDDFDLRLEYLITPEANSGIYVRVPASGNHHRADASAPAAGFEVQILDDRARRYAGLKDYQFTASVYDIAGAWPRVSKPLGNWNSLEINCAGQHVIVLHNGIVVVDCTAEHSPMLALRSSRGFIGLQSHNGLVRFRNILIGPPRADLASSGRGSRPADGRRSEAIRPERVRPASSVGQQP